MINFVGYMIELILTQIKNFELRQTEYLQNDQHLCKSYIF